MRIDCCDVCLADGIVTPTSRYYRWKATGVKVFVCDEHVKAIKGMTSTQAMEVVGKASDTLFRVQFPKSYDMTLTLKQAGKA
jgi:hypothetical protein